MKFTVSQPHSASQYYSTCINESLTQRLGLLHSAMTQQCLPVWHIPPLHTSRISVWKHGSVRVNVSLAPQSFSFLRRAYVIRDFWWHRGRWMNVGRSASPGRIAENHFDYPAGGQHMADQTASRSRQRVTGIYILAHFSCILLRVSWQTKHVGHFILL